MKDFFQRNKIAQQRCTSLSSFWINHKQIILQENCLKKNSAFSFSLYFWGEIARSFSSEKQKKGSFGLFDGNFFFFCLLLEVWSWGEKNPKIIFGPGQVFYPSQSNKKKLFLVFTLPFFSWKTDGVRTLSLL